MDELGLRQLREEVFAASTRRDSFDHGDRHWRAVGRAGLELAPQVEGCEPLVVFLFALFHDSMRENEFDDPEHGLRGGELARSLLAGHVPDSTVEAVYAACRGHTHVDRSDDPTIGTCWDADRLNLWRVGKTPNPRFLSTEAARDPELIQRAAGFHEDSPDWDDLARRSLEPS